MFRIGDEWSDGSYNYIIVAVDEDEARVQVFDSEACVDWHSESDWETYLVEEELMPIDTVSIGERIKSWVKYHPVDFPKAYKGTTAWWREETEPCEAGTVGCSANHNVQEGCETW